jgi:transcriptional regulator GlxA family with amidase domain
LTVVCVVTVPHEIAGQVGFGGGTSLREHLHAAIGVSPLAYRRTFRGTLSPTQ